MDTPEFDTEARKRDGARPTFYKEAVQNQAASASEGRPVFFEREMVRILIPGDRLTESVQIVTDNHRQRWPREYGAFKANEEAPLSGTPIEELAGLSKAQIEELKFSRVRTIEDLAGLPDDLLSKVAPMNGKEIRAKAQRRIEIDAGNAPMEKLAAENAQQAATIQELMARMASLEQAAKAAPKTEA